ncbi:MAG: hypothetical protein CVU56_29680 [Deltaproteobacteria bacterium HGW-Deltaproteobacteria-14]|jgi:hypothetical protein|nr:MAG: hypothetical protein CVU56_29680 [Deltaproteobacteria bacterium HGW-Deltaproteobacteria-14]
MAVPFFYSTTSEESADAVYDWRSDAVGAEGGAGGAIVARGPTRTDGDWFGEEDASSDGDDAEERATPDAAVVLEGDESWGFATDVADDDDDEDAGFGATQGGAGPSEAETDEAVAFAVGWDEDEDEGDWNGLAELDLPEFDGGAQQPLELVTDGRLTLDRWREGWVEDFVTARGAVSREDRRLLERIVAESMNPAATLKRVGVLLGEDDRWDEVRACFELRVAWREHGELGTAWAFRQYGSVSIQIVDIELSWRAARRILRAFPAVPCIDEALVILEALHRAWERSYRAMLQRFLVHGQVDYDAAPRFFVDYAVDMLERHGDPFYWAELA